MTIPLGMKPLKPCPSQPVLLPLLPLLTPDRAVDARRVHVGALLAPGLLLLGLPPSRKPSARPIPIAALAVVPHAAAGHPPSAAAPAATAAQICRALLQPVAGRPPSHALPPCKVYSSHHLWLLLLLLGLELGLCV